MTGVRAGAEQSLPTSCLMVVPNPAACAPVVRFSLAEPGQYRLELLDAGGRRVAAWSGVGRAGAFRLEGLALPGGAYVVRLARGRERLAQRFAVVR
jgi:hypothetical protein